MGSKKRAGFDAWFSYLFITELSLSESTPS